MLCGGCDSGPSSSTTEQQAALRGKALMSQYQCGSCHAIPGVADARGVSAVSLEGFARRSYIGGRLPNRPSTLEAWIIDPHAQIAAANMPALAVSPEQARDMAAYLRTLK
ncbi:c-type cytochrome [Diaphorobacter aerolatus]|uniref:c-type cytochrome n=1 Tax=Diaphorobacter aerolatus TaxID=1288495 RepID=UPI001D01F07C|nr:c-type cytochrome [Diaphorobacter aerolatus]